VNAVRSPSTPRIELPTGVGNGLTAAERRVVQGGQSPGGIVSHSSDAFALQQPMSRTLGTRIALALLRVGLPVAIAFAGIILIALGGDSRIGLGAALLVISLLVFLTDVLARLAISSQNDRAREEAARERFRATGRWPRAPRAT
jgi:hypothetical protein